MVNELWDLVIIGGGPGGYVAALRGARLGFKVACVDQGALPGGTCLHHGCIPSKSLLEDAWKYRASRAGLADGGTVQAMMTRKSEVVNSLAQGIVGLFKKHRVTWIQGRGWVVEPGLVIVQDKEGGERPLKCRHILLATGSRSRSVPGIVVDGQRILDSSHALALNTVPATMAVLGGGAIGLEMASLWSRLGCQVTVVEAMGEILPGSEAAVVRHVRRILQKQGIVFRTGVQVGQVEIQEGGVFLNLAGSEGVADSLTVERVLVAVGREPQVTAAPGLGLALDGSGRVRVDERFQTSQEGIFALGDLTPGPMLAHRAMAEGVRFAELLASHPHPAPVSPVPSVVYTHPEIAAVGLTEAQAKKEYDHVRCGQAFFMANARARCAGEAEGVVKVVAEGSSGRLLGVHMVGPGVSELVTVAVVALQGGWGCSQLGGVVFPHPSLGETLKEATLAVIGEAVHL